MHDLLVKYINLFILSLRSNKKENEVKNIKYESLPRNIFLMLSIIMFVLDIWLIFQIDADWNILKPRFIALFFAGIFIEFTTYTCDQ